MENNKAKEFWVNCNRGTTIYNPCKEHEDFSKRKEIKSFTTNSYQEESSSYTISIIIAIVIALSLILK